jgi:hypothetical protein
MLWMNAPASAHAKMILVGRTRGVKQLCTL